MPLPKPTKDEDKKTFIDRCMADDTMQKEYPDEKQRYAICLTQWDGKKLSNCFIERRYIPVDTEFRFDSEKNKLEGYAAKFNVYSDDLGGFRERIKIGAFKKTIKENDIRALFNHDPNYVLGRTTNGTLELSENGTGLKFRIDLPETTFAKDLKISIDRGDISQCSFGFQTIKDEWSEDFKKRDLLEAKLFDISPVTFPAYPQTEVKLRTAMLDMGIDYNALNLIILKSSRNIELIDDDYDLINKTINILNSFLPQTSEPLAEKHSVDNEEPPDYDTLVRLRIKRHDLKKILGGKKV